MGFQLIQEALQTRCMHKFAFKVFLPKWKVVEDIKQAI